VSLHGYRSYYKWSQFGSVTIVRVGKFQDCVARRGRTFSSFRKVTHVLYLIQAHI
jgi:hypothetical protein